MIHAISLGVIGQALEHANVTVFELEKHGQSYVVWSDALSDAKALISHYGLSEDACESAARQSKTNCSLCFNAADINRLDRMANKRRRLHTSYVQKLDKLSQLLRTVGDHLDRNSVKAFHISWTPESVSVVQLPTGDLKVERVTLAEKLKQLSLHTRFRRSRPHTLH